MKNKTVLTFLKKIWSITGLTLLLPSAGIVMLFALWALSLTSLNDIGPCGGFSIFCIGPIDTIILNIALPPLLIIELLINSQNIGQSYMFSVIGFYGIILYVIGHIIDALIDHTTNVISPLQKTVPGNNRKAHYLFLGAVALMFVVPFVVNANW